MPYTHTNSRGREYVLHAKRVKLPNGRQQTLYYFATEPRRGEAADALPEGYCIVENPRTGLPYLKLAGQGDGTNGDGKQPTGTD